MLSSSDAKVREVMKLTEGLVAMSLWQIGTDSVCGDVSVESNLGAESVSFFILSAGLCSSLSSSASPD